MTPMLELKDFHYSYGAIHVLKGISMTVEQGETVALIGSNGAGKTTTLRAISGLVPAKGMQNGNQAQRRQQQKRRDGEDDRR